MNYDDKEPRDSHGRWIKKVPTDWLHWAMIGLVVTVVAVGLVAWLRP